MVKFFLTTCLLVMIGNAASFVQNSKAFMQCRASRVPALEAAVSRRGTFVSSGALASYFLLRTPEAGQATGTNQGVKSSVLMDLDQPSAARNADGAPEKHLPQVRRGELT